MKPAFDIQLARARMFARGLSYADVARVLGYERQPDYERNLKVRLHRVDSRAQCGYHL